MSAISDDKAKQFMTEDVVKKIEANLQKDTKKLDDNIFKIKEFWESALRLRENCSNDKIRLKKKCEEFKQLVAISIKVNKKSKRVLANFNSYKILAGEQYLDSSLSGYLKQLDDFKNESQIELSGILKAIFNTRKAKTDNSFNKALNKLAIYRRGMNIKAKEEFVTSVSKLKRRVGNLASLLQSFEDFFKAEEISLVEKLERRQKRVQNLAFPPSDPLNNLISLVEQLLAQFKKDFSEQEQKALNEALGFYLETFPKDTRQNFSDKLDETVYHLSKNKDPNVPDWGKLHRFDDLTIFLKALNLTALELNEERLKANRSWKLNDFNDYYKKLSKLGFGPNLPFNPVCVEWSKENFIYLNLFHQQAEDKISKVTSPTPPRDFTSRSE